MSRTQSLLQLAGHYSYKHEDFNKHSAMMGHEVIIVNGKEFLIEDIRNDSETGLDAMTVKNVESGERIVVFVGSEQFLQDWLLTNGMLPGKVSPAQLEAARAYFREMNSIGEVSYVTGNSLGGANRSEEHTSELQSRG